MNNTNLLLPENITLKLNENSLNYNYYYFDNLESTINIAHKIAKEKNKVNSLIVAKEQTMSKGRFNRVWSSPKGGLWFSMILKPNIKSNHVTNITQVAAASIVKALAKFNIDCKIKWPNDVYLNNKKLCGILTEMKCSNFDVNYITIGIGINVNIKSFPDELKDIATSLFLENKKEYNLDQILIEFLKEFDILYNMLIKDMDSHEAIQICKEKSILLNQTAYLVKNNKKEQVTCIGVTDEGALLIKDSLGNITSILSGEISFH
ncbi:MAG: biotin--[acetyl-CoA-carboxylase] ligase [Clostridium sp.]|nr:biotin--[acetyl-CoA-carboxylase] ligase [Clostridium sp.]